MNEIFKVCFENYEVSNLGNCRRKLHNGSYRIIKGSVISSGYKYIQVNRDGKRKNYLIHRWVAKCFIGDQPEDKPFVDHINRNRLDNRVENLRWINHQDNLRNTDRFRDDIKEEGKDRVNVLNAEYRNRVYEQKKYYCKLCDLNSKCISHLEKHKNGYRHKLKERTKEEMAEKNIEWSYSNYKGYLNRKYDLKRRPWKNK